MANVRKYLQDILDAIYGEEVRSSIHDAIDAMNEESTNAEAVAISSQQSAKRSAERAATSETNAKASETAAKTSETAAKASETAAKASETAAKASETAAKRSENNASDSEDATYESEQNAKASENAAKASEDAAAASASSARTYSMQAFEYKHDAEDAATAAYQYEQQCEQIRDDIGYPIDPKGTIAFANLPSISSAQIGWMYNISDDFTTTSDFEEGAGKFYSAGSEVYLNSNNKWSVMAGPGVTGIKGEAESTYHKGQVEITKSMIGIDTLDDIDTPAFTQASTRDNIDSGETVSTILGKIKKFFADLKTVAFTGDASDVSFDPTGTTSSATTVQLGLKEALTNSAPTASDVPYDNTTSGLSSTNVQGAIDESLAENETAISSAAAWMVYENNKSNVRKYFVVSTNSADMWTYRGRGTTGRGNTDKVVVFLQAGGTASQYGFTICAIGTSESAVTWANPTSYGDAIINSFKTKRGNTLYIGTQSGTFAQHYGSYGSATIDGVTYDLIPIANPSTESINIRVASSINAISRIAEDILVYDMAYTHLKQKQVVPSHIGQIIETTTLDTLEKVQAIYGANTNWIQHSGYVLRGATSGVVANSNVKDGGNDSIEHSHTIAHTHTMAHTHTIAHTHTMAHTHTIAHTHTYAHTHGIPAHSHTLSAKGWAMITTGWYYALWTAMKKKTDISWKSNIQAAGPNGGQNNTASTQTIGAALDGATDSHAAMTTNSQSASTTSASSAANSGAASNATTSASSAANSGAASNSTTSDSSAANSGSTTINILPSYKSVYIWERTA